MTIQFRTYHLVWFWIVASWLFLVPSEWYPYSRHNAVYLSATLFSLVAATCLLLASQTRYRPPLELPRLSPYYIHAARAVLIFTIAVDVYGATALETSVFDSKGRLDDLPYVRSIINFKIITIPILYLNRHSDRWSLYAQLFASLVYSILFAERMHLFEVLLALVTTKALAEGWSINATRGLVYVVIGVLLAVGLEATRNFYVQYVVKGETITVAEGIRNLTERVAAYYGDTGNKFSIAVSQEFLPERAVGAEQLAKQILKDEVGGATGTDIGTFARQRGLGFENLTNIGGHTSLVIDLGWFAFVAFVLLGVAPVFSEVLYIKTRSVAALAFASSCTIMVAEMPRLFYWYNLRAYVWVLVVILVLIADSAVRERRRAGRLAFEPR